MDTKIQLQSAPWLDKVPNRRRGERRERKKERKKKTWRRREKVLWPYGEHEGRPHCGWDASLLQRTDTHRFREIQFCFAYRITWAATRGRKVDRVGGGGGTAVIVGGATVKGFRAFISAPPDISFRPFFTFTFFYAFVFFFVWRRRR